MLRQVARSSVAPLFSRSIAVRKGGVTQRHYSETLLRGAQLFFIFRTSGCDSSVCRSVRSSCSRYDKQTHTRYSMASFPLAWFGMPVLRAFRVVNCVVVLICLEVLLLCKIRLLLLVTGLCELSAPLLCHLLQMLRLWCIDLACRIVPVGVYYSKTLSLLLKSNLA